MSVSAPDQIDLMDMSLFTSGRQHELFRQMREHTPLHWNDEPDGPGFWSLVRYEDVRTAMLDQEHLSCADGTQLASRRAEGKLHSLHNMDEPRHGKLRRIANPYLRAIRVEAWRELIHDSTTTLLDEAEERGEIDAVHDIAARLPMLVLGRVLGVPREDGPLMVEWTNRITTDDPDYVPDPAMRDQARDELFAYFRQLTDERRRAPQDDLVSVLGAGRVDGELLEWDELAAYYVLLVAAGNETTRHLISGGIQAFDEFPEAWDAVRAKPESVGSAVEEMLRWTTPVACIRRTALVDHEWYGETIREGQKLVVWFGSANRDQSVFEDPQVFRVDRSSNTHLTFGWGIHACMGAHLARAEGAALFRDMVDRGLRLTLQGEATRLESNLFNGFKRMPVSVTRST